MVLRSGRKRKDFTQLILQKISLYVTIIENIIWHLSRIWVPFVRKPLNNLDEITNKTRNKALESSSVSSQNKLVIYSSLVELLDNWGKRNRSHYYKTKRSKESCDIIWNNLKIIKWTVKSTKFCLINQELWGFKDGVKVNKILQTHLLQCMLYQYRNWDQCWDHP